MIMLGGMFKINCRNADCHASEYFINTGSKDFQQQMILRAGWQLVSIDVSTKECYYVCEKCFNQLYSGESKIKTNKIPIPPTIPAFFAKGCPNSQPEEIKTEKSESDVNQKMFSIECAFHSYQYLGMEYESGYAG